MSMTQLEEKAAEALEYVRKAETIMAELGHTKYSLSGMCSAAMRHDLEKEVCELLGELAEAREQRDALVEALEMVATHTYVDGQCDNGYSPQYVAKQALAAMKGGWHE